MKVTVMIIGVLGALGAGLIGLKWLGDASANAETIKKLEEYERSLQQTNTTVSAAMSSKLSDLNKFVFAAYLLIAGAVGGIVTLALMHRNTISALVAGLLLIACSLLPGLLAPPSFVFSGLMIVAGGLCLLLHKMNINKLAQTS